MSQLYGLIGFPLGHSRSADYFNRKFKSDGPSDALYRLFPIPSLVELPHLLEQYPNLRGFNVTIPFKEKIIPLLAGIDEEAKTIGSVNAVLVAREGEYLRMKGFNTDAGAFASTLPETGGHRKALVLGTGGSARTVAHVLAQKGIEVTFVSRTKSGPGVIQYEALREEPAVMNECSLIVNTTPVGMFPDTNYLPDIPYDRLGSRHLLYDLVYNPLETLFLRKGTEHGARICTGEAMFLRQAELSYDLFLKEPEF